MRSEDRKPSKRVFPLLQNLDLDTVTFEQVQGVGDAITIEDMNEQELQDLVLVNLARLVVSGEWTGLLEAGGGGSFGLELMPPDFNDGMEYSLPALTPPYGNDTVSQQWAASGTWFYPFVCSKSGDLASMSIYVGTVGGVTSGTFDVGIYSDVDGVPTALLGYAQFACSSTGTIIDSSLSATITLERGTQYWIGCFKNSLDGNPYIYSAKYDTQGAMGIYGTVFQQNSPTIFTTASAFPATITASDLVSTGGLPRVNVGLKW